MKKVYSILAIVFLVSSGLNASSLEYAKSCMTIAVELHADLQDAGMSHEDAYRISGDVLNACEGAQ